MILQTFTHRQKLVLALSVFEVKKSRKLWEAVVTFYECLQTVKNSLRPSIWDYEIKGAIESCCYLLGTFTKHQKLVVTSDLRLWNQGSYHKLLLCFKNVYQPSKVCCGPVFEVMKSGKLSEAVATFYERLQIVKSLFWPVFEVTKSREVVETAVTFYKCLQTSEACFGPIFEVAKWKEQSEAVATFLLTSKNCQKLVLALYLRLKNQGSYEKLLLRFTNDCEVGETRLGPAFEVTKSRELSEPVATFCQRLPYLRLWNQGSYQKLLLHFTNV